MNENEIADASKMAELVDYQVGAVVSRTLVKGKGGSVSVFAFDGGQELSEHTAPHKALVQLLDGEAEVTIEGRPHRLHKSEMLLLSANRPHSVKATKRFKMVLTMIHS